MREPPRRSLLDSGQAGERLAAFSWTQDKLESRAPLSPGPRTSRRAARRFLLNPGQAGETRAAFS